MDQTQPVYPLIVPQAGSFLFRGGKIGCLLVHGCFNSAEEILPLGEFLAHNWSLTKPINTSKRLHRSEG